MNDASHTTILPLTEAVSAPSSRPAAPSIPGYMIETYNWAYVDPRNVALLDRNIVVDTILWTNRVKLMNASHCEFRAGQKVLQAAHVYGTFTPELAKVVGPDGRLDVIDVVPVQVEHGRRKLAPYPQARIWLGDAATPPEESYDAVSCYFLLHEMPDDYKLNVVNALLERVEPGGKVVWIDYHKPSNWFPLKAFMYFIFHWLEPYAFGVLDKEIRDYARNADRFGWRKETYFGGLYQKVVAERIR